MMILSEIPHVGKTDVKRSQGISTALLNRIKIGVIGEMVRNSVKVKNTSSSILAYLSDLAWVLVSIFH